MIGQKKLQEQIINQINNDTFPRFSIITGFKGSGKKTLIHTIAPYFNANVVFLEDVKVDIIRSMITTAYKVSDKTIYVIPDADNMSLAAKNTILKVTEEPPYNAYFIMTLTDTSLTLPTILSRGVVYRIEVYTPNDILEYVKENYEHLDSYDRDIIVDIAETPLEVNQLVSYDVRTFYNYVELVVSNIAEVSGANSFKIADKIELSKEDTEKFDLKLFWKIFMNICFTELRKSYDIKYSDAIRITSKCLQDLNITGINKQMLFDVWLLEIRKSWM